MGVVQINTTNINILTLLSQEKFSLEELSLYLNLEKKSIYKNINSINSFLKDENLPLIEVKNSIYSIDLSKSQWANLFTRKDFITTDEIIDYLYLKFIHNGFINLEVEKELLNISRSSIIRYFNDVKKTLELNGSQYEYVVGKGLRLAYLSQTNKNIFSYENYIFKVRNIVTGEKEKTIINILENILKKYDLNLFFCDKISIAQIIIKIVIEHNKSSLKKFNCFNFILYI